MGRHGGGSSGGGGGGGASFGGLSHIRGYSRREIPRDFYPGNEKKKKPKVFLFFFSAVFLYMLCFHTFIPGEKVNGNPNRIVIQDTIDLLTPDEEQLITDLFYKVYTTSGMPITLYTDDMTWKEKHSSIETYSEELYYAMGADEDAMIILFTRDRAYNWIFDIYCGDDTTKCLSNPLFKKLVDRFQKGMTAQGLFYALNYSLNSIMNDMAKTYFDLDRMLQSAAGILGGYYLDYFLF